MFLVFLLWYHYNNAVHCYNSNESIFFCPHLISPGDFQFAVASDDNSELWLSSDESPLNARLLVYVGQVSVTAYKHSASQPLL